MQIVHDLPQAVLGLVLTGHIGELDALGGFDIDPGVAPAEAEGHRIGPAGPVHHLLCHILSEQIEQRKRQNPAEQQRDPGAGLFDDLAVAVHLVVQQPLGQIRVGEHTRLVDDGVVLIGKEDLIFRGLDIGPGDLAVFHHRDKGIVVHLPDLPLGQPWHHKQVEQQQHQHHHSIVIEERLLRFFHFIHREPSTSYRSRQIPHRSFCTGAARRTLCRRMDRSSETLYLL